MRFSLAIAVLFSLVVFLVSCSTPASKLILTNAEIYTMDPEQPWASSIIIEGNRIAAVLNDGESIEAYVDAHARLIDLEGKFVVPGFIDGHVHFNRAGELINDANLMTVADDEGLRKELIRVAALLDDGEWITGGMWGAYEQWALGAAESGLEKKERWKPRRSTIDAITDKNPCLLSSFDGALYLADTSALRAAGLEEEKLPGMVRGDDGKPTGLIERGSPALDRIRSRIGEKSHNRLMNENRAALKALAESGIVEIHDIAVPGQTERFIALQEKRELTCRIWLRPDLSRGKEMKEKGFRVIHAQVIREEDFPRFEKLKVIAEVNPYHISDDMRWMEERIGHERCKGAYAFRSLLDNGATLSFGSDWPGTSAAEYHMHPRYLIHAAVNRTTLKGTPVGGWFPEQKISVHDALEAYTINSACAAFEGDIRGSITPGKLADITVCDRNLLKIDPGDILKMNVDMTIVDGTIVYDRAASPGS